MKRQMGSAVRPWTTSVLTLVLLTIPGLANCGKPAEGSSRPQAPVTTPAGPEIQAVPGKEVTIQASAAGAESYEWKLDGPGKLSKNDGPVVDYTPPENGGGRATLSVTARNDQGTSSPTLLSIRLVDMVSVRLDALAIPAGWMSGGGDPLKFISLDAVQTGCHDRSGCTRITYRPGGQWGGIFWWPQSCGTSGTKDAWDKVKSGTCGVNVLQAANIKEARRLTFWVRGEHGGEGVEFKIGAVDIEPKPGRSLGNVALTDTWERKEIDLTGMNLTNAAGLFAWIATDAANPQGATFYLDGIQIEGVR
jgi:hypothetical protein